MELLQGSALCAQFDLGDLRAVKVAGGTRNANYVFTTDAGKWFVRRRHPAYCDAARIRFDHAAAHYLAERGAPVLSPRQSVAGETWWEDGDAVWEVFPFVEGRPLREGDMADAATLGTALAQFHRTGRDFPLRFEKAAPRGETDPEHLLGQADRLAHDSAETTEAVAGYRAAVLDAREALPSAAYAALPHTLIHGDVQPANLILRDGRLRAFVDLDWCAWQARLYDLCFAVLVCCASHATPIDGGDIRSLTQTPRLEPETIAAFLNAYASAGEPLTPAERDALPAQLLLSWCHMRLAGAFKVPPEERAAFLNRPPELKTERLVLPPLG